MGDLKICVFENDVQKNRNLKFFQYVCNVNRFLKKNYCGIKMILKIRLL